MLKLKGYKSLLGKFKADLVCLLFFLMLNSVYTDGDGVKIEILNNQVSQSTTLNEITPAINAIDGTNRFSHTNVGAGEW